MIHKSEPCCRRRRLMYTGQTTPVIRLTIYRAVQTKW